MIKIILALGGALALTGCVAGDRVTLLESAQIEKRETGEVGAVAVLNDDVLGLNTEEYEALEMEATDRAVIDQQNQQARLRRGKPSVRQLNESNPAYAELLGSLPLEVAVERFGFELGSRDLSPEVLGKLVVFLEQNIQRYKERYELNADYQGDPPGLQIEIAGYADSSSNTGCPAGETGECNRLLSERRAAYVYYQLLAALEQSELQIDPVESIEIFGAGDQAALIEAGGARSENSEYRAVWVTFR